MSTSKPRSREPLTTRQRSILIAFYNTNPYPSSSERHSLVQLTGRTLKQIQDWFANRRRTDSRLISTSNISLPPAPSQPIPMQPVYYSSPCSMCPCCSQLQSSPMDNHPSCSPDSGYYFPMIYYPPFNNYPT